MSQSQRSHHQNCRLTLTYLATLYTICPSNLATFPILTLTCLTCLVQTASRTYVLGNVIKAVRHKRLSFSMAASFYSSPLIGATTTLACFAHEIPHEIADYSILIRSGFTKKQAMQSQFLTAVGAFVRFFTRILAPVEFQALLNIYLCHDVLADIVDRLGENNSYPRTRQVTDVEQTRQYIPRNRGAQCDLHRR